MRIYREGKNTVSENHKRHSNAHLCPLSCLLQTIFIEDRPYS
jgi:hypothetical protein